MGMCFRPVILSALALAACAPQARLATPAPLRSDAWRDRATGTVPLAAAWGAFGSPELDALLARAGAANADLAIARTRVLQARGQLGVARAESRPGVSAFVDAGGGTNRSGYDSTDRPIGLDIAYDVDLFGGARAGRRAARARLAASAFDRDATALVVEAEVARAFVEHAAFDARLDLLAQGLSNARELDRIIAARVREGAATRVDAGLQRLELRRIEAEASRLEEARARTRNALAVLVGAEAPGFDPPRAALDDLRPPAFAAAQPAALLNRRPDIRAAEARIAAANGDVAQARAAFLPSFRVSAGSIVETGPLGLALSAVAGLVAPIFDGGRLRGRFDTATGAQAETIERYRRALLVALGEAEDALAGADQSSRRVDLLTDSVAVARETARLARRQYVEGAADLQTVLDAERGALDFAEAAAIARRDRLLAAIDLYRALGGRPDPSAPGTPR